MNTVSAIIDACATTAFAPSVAYMPLVDPIGIEGYWLLVPLVIAIAVVYKTIKLENIARLPREATILAAQILVFMVLAAATLWLLVEGI